MPTVETRASLPDKKALCVSRTKPSISCIASHAYWDKVSTQRELKYATSFQKSQDYLDSLRGEVTDVVFKDCIENNTTPVYVFEEIKGIYHSPEHPLINKGLLAATKQGQLAGYTTPIETFRPTLRPRSQPANRSFYRPNSTHNYLTKTIALGGSHDGFNPKHGTPTRAQLLRNRLKFTSAPDLTYSYIAQRKDDGKHEAFHLKAKLDEEALQLKANKIEMDKTAGKYRKYMIGSRYNTEKWLETHVHYVSGMVARRNDRPASSFTPRSTPLISSSKRRAVSAVASRKPLREDAAAQTLTKEQGKLEAFKKENCYIPLYREPKKEVERPMMARSPNMVPYTASVNCKGGRDLISTAIIIKPAAGSAETREAEKLNKRLESARRLKSHIEGSLRSSNEFNGAPARVVTPSPAISIKENVVELESSTKDIDQPMPPVGTTSKQPNSPVGTAPKQPVSPVGTTPERPVSLLGTTPKRPMSPLGITPERPMSPLGTTSERPVSPLGTTSERPVSPLGTTPEPVFMTNEQETEDQSKLFSLPSGFKEPSLTSSHQSNKSDLLKVEQNIASPDASIEGIDKLEGSVSLSPTPISNHFKVDLRSVVSESETLSKSQEFTTEELGESSEYVIDTPRVVTHSESLARATVKAAPIFEEAASEQKVNDDIPEQHQKDSVVEDNPSAKKNENGVSL
ncbi:uncharacterized protein [Watersipora subatra]|uniref:uncharacterized protein n=1 Tax=Watersipora subatra TaxID=2589382 RepID=UPI00355BCCFE